MACTMPQIEYCSSDLHLQLQHVLLKAVLLKASQLFPIEIQD